MLNFAPANRRLQKGGNMTGFWLSKNILQIGGGKITFPLFRGSSCRSRHFLFSLQKAETPFFAGVVAALLLAGCSGDDPAAVSLPDPLTRTAPTDSTAQQQGGQAFSVSADTAWADTLRQQY